MTIFDSETKAIQSIEATIREAKDSLRMAEQVAVTVPQLRRQIKVLERAYTGLTLTPTPRRKLGPTIKDSIFEALEAAGGRIEFEPTQMLNTIHGITGGKRTSVQVEIHRLRAAGRLVAEYNADGKPTALSIVHPLTYTQGGAS